MITQCPDVIAGLRNWLVDDALPFWGTIGYDYNAGGFHERLDMEARPISSVPRRLLVQARQIYVFSHAHQLGWFSGGAELAARAVDHLFSRYQSREGGFVFSIDPAGEVTDPRRNTYGHAFVILALAVYGTASNDHQAFNAAIDIIDFLIERLSDGSGAFFSDLPATDAYKHQNPHMHLLEALLALYEVTRSSRVLERAQDIVRLFEERLLNRELLAVNEVLENDWSISSEANDHFWEPGHSFEWAWLLHQFQRISGQSYNKKIAEALFRRAKSVGVTKDGRIFDRLGQRNEVLLPSTRCWPMTEAIKAGAVITETQDQNNFVGCMATNLRKYFLERPFKAGWIDHLDQYGSPIVTYVPATTLYHLLLAVAVASPRGTAAKTPNYISK